MGEIITNNIYELTVVVISETKIREFIGRKGGKVGKINQPHPGHAAEL